MNTLLIRLIALLMLAAGTSAFAAEHAPVRAVPSLDLPRYLGKWYEIAAFPMYFQRNCVGGTTAEYTLRPDGDIAVRNRCRTEDGHDEANGHAWVNDATYPAQLKVSFFWPFRSDYWIVGLDAEYRWAVVGNPNRKYLWILSRTPVLPKPMLDAALNAAAAQGYDLGQLRYTKQEQTE
ncbi:MAG TPA: lipocalin family protein [Gallionella sp.]|nr:lipocalin family protein [Gallionella sp.]